MGSIPYVILGVFNMTLPKDFGKKSFEFFVHRRRFIEITYVVHSAHSM